MQLRRKRFDRSDETRTLDRGRVELVELGELAIGRATLSLPGPQKMALTQEASSQMTRTTPMTTPSRMRPMGPRFVRVLAAR